MPGKPAVFRPDGRSAVQAEAASDQARGSARERGYSPAWDRAALAEKRLHPLCLGCEAVGRVEPTTVIDHVIPHKGDAALFWDRNNWQPGCDWHHNVIKKLLEARYARGELTAADLRLDSHIAIALTRTEARG